MRPKKRNMFSVARKSPKSCFKQQTLPATAEGTPYFFGSDLAYIYASFSKPLTRAQQVWRRRDSVAK